MKKFENHLSKRRQQFLETSLLLIIFICGCVLRYVVYTQASWWPADLGKTYFADSQVTTGALQFADTTYIFKLYISFLHTICLVFGNIYEICLFAHFIMFVLAILVWHFVVKKLFNWGVALVLSAICFIAPFSIVLSCTLNPFVLWVLLFGIVLLMIVSCAKWLLNNKSNKHTVPKVQTDLVEPVVTVVNFDNEKAVVVPNKEERPVIFIPKSMDTPKRIAKPKVDFIESVTDEKLCYDVEVPEQDDYDLS